MGFSWSSVLAALVLASVLAYGLFLWGFAHTRRFLKNRSLASGPLRGVSILKPCAGYDDALERSVESYFHLDYPAYELLLGVASIEDTAVPVLRKLLARYPHVSARLLVTREGISPNPKVSQLECLQTHAQYDLLWISDSNTCAHPSALRELVSALHSPEVGVVLSPVVGTGEHTLGAALENLQLAAFVGLCTGAVHTLSGRVVGPGKSMLLRAEALASIGGFRRVGRYLAEDYLLIEWLVARGWRAELVEKPIETLQHRTSLQRFYARQHRWSQLRWVVEPLAVSAEWLLTPSISAVLWALCCPSTRSVLTLVAVLLFQALGDAWLLVHQRGHSLALRHWPAFVLRPLVLPFVWGTSMVSRRVSWRGNVRWLGRETEVLAHSRFARWRSA